MISRDELIQSHREIANDPRFTEEAVDFWAKRADDAIHPKRLAKAADGSDDLKMTAYAKRLFIIHAITKPTIDLSRVPTSPVMSGNRGIRYLHPWDGTLHGQALRRIVKA